MAKKVTKATKKTVKKTPFIFDFNENTRKVKFDYAEGIGNMGPLLLETAAQIIVTAAAVVKTTKEAESTGLIRGKNHPLTIMKEQLEEALNSQMPKEPPHG